eukprot:3733424-Amphidinium_carterae.1
MHRLSTHLLNNRLTRATSSTESNPYTQQPKDWTQSPFQATQECFKTANPTDVGRLGSNGK